MSESDPRIVVIGAHAPGVLVRVDRIPIAGETVIAREYSEPLDGGKGSNQALAVSRLGEPVAFVGKIGSDARGREAEALLRDSGVNTRHLLRSESQPTGNGVNLLDADGTPAMITVTGANAELSVEDVELALTELSSAKVLLVQLEIPVEVALHALKRGKQLGMLTVLNAAPACVEAQSLSGQDIDVLVVNEIEAQTLLATTTTATERRTLATRLREGTGIDGVIVTLGEQGLVGCDGLGTWHHKAISVPTLDTSGAGDVFCAALTIQLQAGSDLRTGSSWAALAAAASVTRLGTIEAFPSPADVERLRAGQPL